MAVKDHSSRREALLSIHHDHLTLEATRPLFVSMLIDKARAIDEVVGVVRLLLSGEKGRELRISELSIPDENPTAVAKESRDSDR